MKITCIQMETALFQPEDNFPRAQMLVEKAAAEKPDVIVLPETWNTGFSPSDALTEACDPDGSRTKALMGALAGQFSVNLVAGSISRLTDGKVFNTAYVFDRTGACVAEYDKTHLFSPSGEDRYYAPGDHLCRFTLDGVPCGLMVCYDLRFPRLARTLTLDGAELLFVVAQWPAVRRTALRTLAAARAIENEVFLAVCNASGTGKCRCGGSAVFDPLGEPLAEAGEDEALLAADCDFTVLSDVRNRIPVFRDRHPELYDF